VAPSCRSEPSSVPGPRARWPSVAATRRHVDGGGHRRGRSPTIASRELRRAGGRFPRHSGCRRRHVRRWRRGRYR
jgi:hypothetical protein